MKENFELEDKLWMARTGLNRDTLCGAIETVIFMSDKPLPLSKIRGLIDQDLPLGVLHEVLLRLQEEYESRHHGIRLMEVAEGYQFRTKTTYFQYVQDLFKVNSLVLSPTALEVLALIAYKQPIPRMEVDKVRGVDSGHIIRNLMDKRLVKIVGKSEEMGRPVLYGTTPEFLEVFNLANLEELPSEGELERNFQEDAAGETKNIKDLVHGGDKGRFIFEDMQELDQLAESIKAIPTDTSFTASLKSGEKKETAFDILEQYLQRQAPVKESEESEETRETKNANIIKELKDKSLLDSQELKFDQQGLEEVTRELEEKNGQLSDKGRDLDLNLDFETSKT